MVLYCLPMGFKTIRAIVQAIWILVLDHVGHPEQQLIYTPSASPTVMPPCEDNLIHTWQRIALAFEPLSNARSCAIDGTYSEVTKQ